MWHLLLTCQTNGTEQVKTNNEQVGQNDGNCNNGQGNISSGIVYNMNYSQSTVYTLSKIKSGILLFLQANIGEYNNDKEPNGTNQDKLG